MVRNIRYVSYQLQQPDQNGNEFIAIALEPTTRALYGDGKNYQVVNKELLPSLGKTRAEAINNLQNSLQNAADSLDNPQEGNIQIYV